MYKWVNVVIVNQENYALWYKKKEYNRHIKNIAFRTAWARSKPLEMPRGLRVWTERKDTILTFKYSDS